MADNLARAARTACGVSQAKFAEAIGAATSTVARWEIGAMPPDPMTQTLLTLIRDMPEVRARLFPAPDVQKPRLRDDRRRG